VVLVPSGGFTRELLRGLLEELEVQFLGDLFAIDGARAVLGPLPEL